MSDTVGLEELGQELEHLTEREYWAADCRWKVEHWVNIEEAAKEYEGETEKLTA